MTESMINGSKRTFSVKTGGLRHDKHDQENKGLYKNEQAVTNITFDFMYSKYCM